MLRNALFVFTLWLPMQLFALSVDSTFLVQVDLASRWVWRGVSYSESPVIQPSFNFNTEKLNLQVWGSYPIERRSYSEIDFVAEYQISPFIKLGFTDYFGINDSIGAKHDFFNFNRKSTNHLLDFYTVISPFSKIPLTFQYSIWLWGADRDAVSGKQNLSSYFETKYEKELANDVVVGFFVGGSPWKGFYSKKAAVVNIGLEVSRPLTFPKSFSIPCKVAFVLNPDLKNVYVNAIITLK